MFFLQAGVGVTSTNFPEWVQWIIVLAPILSFAAALVNLILAATVFGFTRKKNNSDRNIKWFQELVYTPNKEIFNSYFNNLYKLKDDIPSKADITEEESIDLMNTVKAQRQIIFSNFVDVIKHIDKNTHKTISESIDGLTDSLTEAFGNDQLKWNNPKTIQSCVIDKVTICKNQVIVALFNYKG